MMDFISHGDGCYEYGGQRSNGKLIQDPPFRWFSSLTTVNGQARLWLTAVDRAAGAQKLRSAACTAAAGRCGRGAVGLA
jgi:hypothetical protein